MNEPFGENSPAAIVAPLSGHSLIRAKYESVGGKNIVKHDVST